MFAATRGPSDQVSDQITISARPTHALFFSFVVVSLSAAEVFNRSDYIRHYTRPTVYFDEHLNHEYRR